MPPSLRSSTAMLGLAAAIWVTAGWHADAATLAPGTGGPSSWTVYHGDAAGTGVAAPMTAIDTTAPAWTSPALDGEIYGEPLVFSKRVYVATENDTVYALSSATGAIIWSVHLGTPVPAGSLPCGNITPTVGITGTPVIDPARAEIFVVADELVNGAPAHLLVGLAATSGKSELTQPVDPAGADTATLLQRTGLTLDAGQVVFGFGGNLGQKRANPARGSRRSGYRHAAAADWTDPRRRSGRVRLRRQLRRLWSLPRQAGGGSRDGRDAEGLHRRRRGR